MDAHSPMHNKFIKFVKQWLKFLSVCTSSSAITARAYRRDTAMCLPNFITLSSLSLSLVKPLCQALYYPHVRLTEYILISFVLAAFKPNVLLALLLHILVNPFTIIIIISF